jgi:hypothetical protein
MRFIWFGVLLPDCHPESAQPQPGSATGRLPGVFILQFTSEYLISAHLLRPR